MFINCQNYCIWTFFIFISAIIIYDIFTSAVFLFLFSPLCVKCKTFCYFFRKIVLCCKFLISIPSRKFKVYRSSRFFGWIIFCNSLTRYLITAVCVKRNCITFCSAATATALTTGCRIYSSYCRRVCLICNCLCTAYGITVFRNAFYSIICFRCDCYCCCVNRIISELVCNFRRPNYRCCIFVCFYFCLRYFIFNRCS